MVDMAEFSGNMDLAQEQVLLVVCSTQVPRPPIKACKI